ncbi:hypothetical protein BX600DRAFT_538385 [Xylariales sp. PMI_506]|nr:hypothetical protein BX600DRAFT_538385 [Xylariales sp. PMI_506]
MSSSSSSSSTNVQPSSFGDVAYHYRIYILDDLLAEPQEICHDWSRNLLYISQRYRQGHSFAPIEGSHEILIFDVAVADVVGHIDLTPYDAPHCLQLDESCSYLWANVSGGTVGIDTTACAVTGFSSTEESQLLTAQQQQQTHGSNTGSSSSSSSRNGRSSRRGGSHHNNGGSSSHRDAFIAEIDLRTGRMRQRVNVPQSETPTDGRFVAFSAPAIRFASRSSSSGMPVIEVQEDLVIRAIKAKFNVRTLYVTSRNVMLV